MNRSLLSIIFFDTVKKELLRCLIFNTTKWLQFLWQKSMLKGFIAVKTSFELVNDSHTDNDYRKLETRPPDVAVITTVQVCLSLPLIQKNHKLILTISVLRSFYNSTSKV